MVPILEDIAAMGPEAMETFVPPALWGDVDLAKAKQRVGDKICMIGGFDQFQHLKGCIPEETREAVQACFEQAGEGGGYILSASHSHALVDATRLQWMVDAAHEHGTYPIRI